MTFTRVCSLADLKDGMPAGFEVDDTPIVLVRQGGQVYALADVCSHAEIALSEGEVTRQGLECWLHGSCFDLRTGQPSSPPASEPVATYAVTVDGDDVCVDVHADAHADADAHYADAHADVDVGTSRLPHNR